MKRKEAKEIEKQIILAMKDMNFERAILLDNKLKSSKNEKDISM